MASSIKTTPLDLWSEAETNLLETQALMSSTSLQASASGKQPAGAAISSTFSSGTLTVTGNKSDNTIEISRNASGALLVNNGAVKTTGGTPTVANTSVIEVYGNGGADTITLNESLGALPRANLYGGAGNDVLTGGSGNDQLFGQGDNDTLLGKGGFDALYGGDGNDVLTGGDADDQMYGEAGDDRMIWNPGDDSDLMEGGSGVDTAEVNGGGGTEQFTVTANGTRVRLDRLDPAPFDLDIGTTENLVVNMNGGDDRFSATGDLASLIKVTVDGGTGNDTILGSNGADTLLGGDGDDFIDGQQGNDAVFLGAGNDVFQWDPGDGNDTVEGQDGTDTLRFNGSAGAEVINLAANGGRLKLARDLGAIVMDLNDVERIEVNALGSTDTIVVGDMTGTDVTEVNVNLAGTLGGAVGDAVADTVVATGTGNGDVINVYGSGTSVSVLGLAATVNVANVDTTLDTVMVSAGGGSDAVDASTVLAGITRLTLDGGTGDDTLIGSQGNDVLLGGDGNDALLGKGGNDALYGGTGSDVLTGGDGDDQVYGEAGDDRMVWNPGDDSDLMEGGDGIDTAEVNGGGGSEVFTVTANGERVRVDRLEPAPFALDIGTTENVVVNMNGGDDYFSATGNLASLARITVDGGTGNDTILGSNGADLLLGGDGDDFIDGQQGNDAIFLGTGDDVFQWDPGDGSDSVEGQDGVDTLRFNGSNVAEVINLAANGGRLKLTRDLGAITMDLNDVERIDVNAMGSADTIVVADLTGTDVTQVSVNLAGTLGGTVGDGVADTVVATGTGNGDVIDVFGSGTSVSVLGLSARVDVTSAEGTLDTLVVNGLGGNDRISATTLPAGVIKLTLDGGAGNDTLLGSQGNDVLLGGDGNDFVFGDNGNDVAYLGAGDDVFQWDPGDGSDVVEGQDGTDTLLFYGANIGENISLYANGGRAGFTRDIGGVAMDLDDVEQIDFRALGGADTIVIGDMSGTDVTRVNLDLRGTNGGADAFIDNVTVNGTQGADTVYISGDAGGVTVAGLQARVNLSVTDPFDGLTVNGLGGADVVDASALQAGAVQLTLNGGLGDDVLVGSAGGDLFNGGDGNDVAFMGAGDDTFVWNPGDDNDTLEGQAGYDTLLFNGANVAENVTISANGGRAVLFRDVANVTSDLNDVERVAYNALGGADTVRVGDLSGTEVTRVDVNLAAIGGAGDGQADNVIVNATTGDDVVVIAGDGAGIAVTGLTARVNVTGTEGALDTITVYGHAGADVIDASAVVAGAVKLVLDGGDGDDVLIGSAGDDVLIGGAGNDVLLGGGGNDVIIGGDGDDIEIQDFVAGAGTDDQIDLSGRGFTFDWLMANAHEVEGGTVLDLGDQQITLRGVALDALHQDDFLV